MHKLESKEQRHLWNIHNTRVLRTLKGSVKLKILETNTFLTVYSFDLINAANAVQLIFLTQMQTRQTSTSTFLSRSKQFTLFIQYVVTAKFAAQNLKLSPRVLSVTNVLVQKRLVLRHCCK